MERLKRIAASLALMVPTGMMVFLAACNGQTGATGVKNSKETIVTLANYGVTSIVPDENSDLTTVNFENGVSVAIHFGGFDDGAPDQTAVSSDGTYAALSALGGDVIAQNWPVITYFDTAGNQTVAGLAGELTASAELDKWAARGNSAALALVAYSFNVGMTQQGVDDLASFKMMFADVPDTSGTDAAQTAKGGGVHAQQVCAQDADNGLPPNLDPDGPDPADCAPPSAPRQCLQTVVNSGWYPCVRNVLASLIALIATRLLWRITCGACLTFLKAALAGGVIFFGSNPVGWLATGGGVLACAVCATLLYTAISNAFSAIRNCITDRPPPINCQPAQ